MATRLDRLFLLLDNGGSSATRKAAALQLGEVVRLHPHESDTLLDRLHSYITSKSWETRIAAGQAVEAIISNMPQWDPQPVKIDDKEPIDIETLVESQGHLSLKSFNIKNILQKGSSLLSDDGSQFEVDEENTNLDPKEKAAQLRLLVNKKLGLVGVDDTDNIISLNDLTPVPENTYKDMTPKESVVQIVQSEMTSAGIIMSSRELNRAKRKAKLLHKQKSIDALDRASDCYNERKKPKLMNPEHCRMEYEDNSPLTIAEDRNFTEQIQEWPLEDFTEQLSRDLFSPSWETRHGAATSIREIIRLHGRGAGKAANMAAKQMSESHVKWLEDKAVRLVCVLALDRFGDFLADQVVAPVRETCAQVLGGVVHLLPERTVMEILYLLQDMLSWHEWGTRLGGLLGLKYILAVRADIRMKLLTQTYEFIFKGLQDEMDDVVAVAATCLVPVAEDLVEYVPSKILSNLLTTLWDALLDIDDLTSSTNSILHLLAKLLSCQKIRQNIPSNLDELIPRIWPFLSHSSCSVRLSALKTIETLTSPIYFVPMSNNKTFGETKLHSQNGSSENGCDSNLIIDFKKENGMEFPDQSKEHFWMEKVLESLLVHTYQRALLENSQDTILLVIKIWRNILENIPIGNLLLVSCRYLPSWLVLLMSNSKAPLDSNLLVFAQHSKGDGHKKLRSSELGESVSKMPSKLYLGGTEGNLMDSQTFSNVSQARRVAGILLGNLSHYVSQPMPGVEYKPDETPILCYVRLLLSHLNSRSGIQRLGAGLVAREWAYQHPNTLCHSLLKAALLNGASEIIYYDEITWSFTRLQQETKDFIAMLRHYKVEVDATFTESPIFTLEQIKVLCESVKNDMLKLRKKVYETLEGRRMNISKSVTQTSGDQIKLNTSIQAVLAGALVRFKSLPEKLNPVIKPLMESIKKEADEQQQEMAAADLTCLLELCIDREPCPNCKVVKNLASFLCVDEDFTPNIVNNPSDASLKDGILSLFNQEKSSCNQNVLKRSNSIGGRGPGRPPSKPVQLIVESAQVSLETANNNLEIKKQNEIQRRGCMLALTSITAYFGPLLQKKLPYMVNMIFDPLKNPTQPDSIETIQSTINWLQFLEVVIPSLDSSILQNFESYLPVLDSLLCHPNSSIRHMTGRVIATLASAMSLCVLSYIIENIVTGFIDTSSTLRRQGAVECVHLTIEKLGFRIVPYVVFLIVPLLGRMSDHDEPIRLLATQCFATLIRLYPLDGGSSNATELSTKLLEQKERERLFLDRLIDPKKIEDYKVPVPINAELRSYQQKGVNWLSFLNQYNLHGILCDDMGLGKTLQSICILAGDHFVKEQKIKENKELSKSNSCWSKTGVQSLVICPPTLTGHWCYEINRFISTKYLNPLHYTGPPVDRKRLREYFPDHNIIVASYKIIRNEIEFFSKTNWNYIILDEGHMIKNGKTKASKAIKELTGSHRLILSGTPIQNNVLELWSLFDFLMPGFLGTERQFMAKYARPILQSRDPKSSGKDQEAGALAMEGLHRQTLPFLLRRVKDDVLKDLPPKITQDYFCELSPLQERLYEDFARSKACQNLDETFNSSEEKGKAPSSHIFQALQYLRRVCNHPKLALLPSHPQYEQINQEINKNKLPLTDINHSAKLPALKQLLVDCGIGSPEDDAGMSTNAIVSPHRALIFCQLKAMLDIIEKDLFKVHMPSVAYLRLDGSVPAGSRHSLVQRFNSDPSIDVLLLTTQVGGLGLNLTGADTVIFVEHDWNPMRDLQAMDRAHRIGQKRVVNVYRLITKGTLEEKIMSLQKFKLMTANSVISHENSSLLSMGTEQLLDLFTLDAKGNPIERDGKDNLDGRKEVGTSNDFLGVSGIRGTRIKDVIENLPEMWDESVYENEYNMENFMASLR